MSWVKAFAIVVPGDIRRDFTANLIADRREMQARGVSPLRMNFSLLCELLNGFAQYAPLRPVVASASPKPRIAEKAALGGAIAWRSAGPALLIGYLLSSTLLIVLGGLLLIGAFGCLVTVAATSGNPMPERQQRFVASVLGGTLASLLLILVFGLVTIGLLAAASVVSSGLLAGLAVKALVLVATASLGVVAGSGWVPEEYTPKRLVVNSDRMARTFNQEPQHEPDEAVV
ncbi:MAG TPA: hypothetical protein VFY93_06675 [Planctomycetota bacterium]|nr:hypothetical protein [Planctomycetota bacterium]